MPKDPEKKPRAAAPRKRAASPSPATAVSTATIKAELIESAPVKRAPRIVVADPEMVILDPTRDEIAMRAYELYVARGRRDGHSDSDWARAEKELNAECERARMALRGPSSRSTTES